MGVTDPKHLPIDEMPAGQKLDALVAEKVMGLRVEWVNGIPMWVGGDELPGSPFIIGPGKFGHTISSYSTDIASAWKVVEHMRKQGCDFDSFASSTRINPDPWADAVFLTPTNEFLTRAKTMELAICRSALKAVLEG